MAALLLGRRPGIGAALVTVAFWTAVSLASGRHYSHAAGLVWSITMRTVTLSLLVVLVTTLQDLVLELGHQAQRDPLTRLFNRRTFDEFLNREVRTARRYGRPLTLAYFDVDNFKSINDGLGHGVGDDVLRTLAETLQARIRPDDVLARFGGDEFLLLLPNLTYAEAQTALERIFGSVSEELPGNASVSIGALTFAEVPEDPEHLVARTDEVLYEVKRSGKAALVHRPA